jgi:hypothetical protein
MEHSLIITINRSKKGRREMLLLAVAAIVMMVRQWLW